MDWKPKTWIAALLGLLLPPFGFLYVVRPWHALSCFLLALVAVFLDLTRPTAIYGAIPPWFMIVWVVALATAVYCFVIARLNVAVATRRWYSHWWGMLLIFAGYFLVALVLRSFLFEPFRHPSTSMRPTIAEGQYFLAKKLGYGSYGSYGITLMHSQPTAPIVRGDILVFELPDNEAVSYVKRVIGLPGDRLVFKNRQLTLDGKVTPTNCAFIDAGVTHCVETLDGMTYTVAYSSDRFDTDFEIDVPAGHYFMMGDNRNNSQDSRFIGPIPAQNLVGKVVHVF